MAKNQLPDKQGATATDAGKFRYIYVRKSVERRVQRRKLATVFLVFVLVALLLTGTIYAVLAFVDNNDFRITIERSNGVLALSQESNFAKTTTQLTTKGPSEMTDTTYSFLPFYQLRMQDGSITNTTDFYASSFYLTNLGDSDCEYREVITITNTFNGLEDCIRVLVVREELQLNDKGEYVQMSLGDDYRYMSWICYGKARADGSSEQVAYTNGRDGGDLDVVVDPNYNAKDKVSPWLCTNFMSDESGVTTNPEFKVAGPKSRIRYTIAVWIEGTDPDTVDARVGGSITMRFGFTTTSAEEQTITK